jgi:hypothetical protein
LPELPTRLADYADTPSFRRKAETDLPQIVGIAAEAMAPTVQQLVEVVQ